MSEWVLSVAELNEYVRRQLAADPMLRALRVRGEITGFKRHVSGHLYFSVKDENARVACVMFRQNAQSLTFAPTDGMRVVLTCQASLYAATGSYQLYCERIEREGAGELFLRFEALKRRLAEEGLFDQSLKQPLPLLPKKIGIVTARGGAALRDMLRVIRRRYPTMPVVLCHASVQGAGAAREIAAALNLLNQKNACDVILCGRGGGSIEDLWAFNEEIVARAIARSAIPVVSCVGHEVDFTIADFVADVRAATPSAAAELAVPLKAELARDLRLQKLRSSRALSAKLSFLRARLLRLEHALHDPARLLIGTRRARLELLGVRGKAAIEARTSKAHAKLRALSRSLAALSPESVLSRGYALIRRADDLVTDARAIAPGDQITLTLRDGRAAATVNEVFLHGEKTDL